MDQALTVPVQLQQVRLWNVANPYILLQDTPAGYSSDCSA